MNCRCGKLARCDCSERIDEKQQAIAQINTVIVEKQRQARILQQQITHLTEARELVARS